MDLTLLRLQHGGPGVERPIAPDVACVISWPATRNATAWAVAVAASANHDVVERRKLELVEADMPCMPIHHPGPLRSLSEIEALAARVRVSAERATAASLDAFASALPDAISSMHLRALPVDFPTDISDQLRPPYDARADAIMYRQVLAAAAKARGWAVQFYDARYAEEDATATLGDRADDVLRGPRNRLGPPWTRDHRIALAATILTAGQ